MLESITDFIEKLIYHNENIQSLSTYGMDGQIYFEWGSPNQKIKIYCGCKKCRALSDFNHELIFF